MTLQPTLHDNNIVGVQQPCLAQLQQQDGLKMQHAVQQPLIAQAPLPRAAAIEQQQQEPKTSRSDACTCPEVGLILS